MTVQLRLTKHRRYKCGIHLPTISVSLPAPQLFRMYKLQEVAQEEHDIDVHATSRFLNKNYKELEQSGMTRRRR